jgi:hypothetical protein
LTSPRTFLVPAPMTALTLSWGSPLKADAESFLPLFRTDITAAVT